MQKLLRYTLLGGIFLVPFIPFIVANSMYFPFITGKNFSFRILIEVLVGVWAVLAYYDPAYRPKTSLLFWALTAFTGIVAIADAFSENPYKSFWSNYERMEGFVGLLHLYGYFIVTVAVLNTEKLWERFWNVSLFASVLMGMYGLFQIGGVAVINQGGSRVDATFGNAAYMAVYALVHIFIAAFFLLKQKRELGMRIVYGTVVALNVVMLYYTATRGAILGLIGGAIVSAVLIALFEKERTVLRKGAIAALAGIVLLVGGFLAMKDTAFVKESQVLSRFANISLQETTTKSRFMVWNMAWQGFKERPLLGWGQESFNFVFNKYYDPQMYAQEPWFDRAHNVFLDWLIAGGILALLAYLSLFGLALYLLWSRVESISLVGKSVLTGLFAAYFFHNLFVFDHLVSYILFFSLLGYLHTASTHEGIGKRAVEKFKKISAAALGGKTGEMIVAPLVIVAVIFSLYFFNYKAMAANSALLQAISPNQVGLSKNIDLFKTALSYGSFGDQEIRESLLRVVSAISTISGQDEAKRSLLELVDKEFQNQIALSPNDLRYHLFYASFLNSVGRYDDAIIHIQRSLELSPKKQTIYFEIVTSYLNKGDKEKALEAARGAFELAPEFSEARAIYATAAIYAGDLKFADELLAPIRGTFNPSDDRVLRAYAIAGRYDKAVEIWQDRIKKDPDNPQWKVSLAAAYLGNGERSKAIAEIEEVMKANPSFKDQGEYYIREIRAGRNP